MKDNDEASLARLMLAVAVAASGIAGIVLAAVASVPP